MATSELDEIPAEVVAWVRSKTRQQGRPTVEELSRLLLKALDEPFPMSTPFMTEEQPAPCDLPLPGPGEPVEAIDGPPPLPDPEGD